jgi:hypothetical protein
MVEAGVGLLMSGWNRARRVDRNARKYRAAKKRGRTAPSNTIIARVRVKGV